MSNRVIHDRMDAVDMVASCTFRDGFYRVITREKAKELLCPISWELLLKDHVRNKGTNESNLYVWNVIDYLCGAKPEKARK